jgi:hypothetical protein
LTTLEPGTDFNITLPLSLGFRTGPTGMLGDTDSQATVEVSVVRKRVLY